MDLDLLTQHELDQEQPGGIVINPYSALGKELRKWEQHKTDLVPNGTQPGNPYVYRPYPKMLYKAQRQPNGQFACFMEPPAPWQYERPEQYSAAVLLKETFDKTCYTLVHDEGQERIALGQGWAEDQAKAMAVHEARERAMGDAAAEVAFAARTMSEKAQRELGTADDSTHEHVVDVLPKRGLKVKGVTGRGEVEE